MAEKETLEYLVEQIRERFERHKAVLTKGSKDPFYTDGVSANLVRNHIIYFKNRVEYICEVNKIELPPECYWELPDEVSADYMARKDEIIANAKKSLDIYENDLDYQFLKRVYAENLSKDQKEILNNVLGYVKGLKIFIENMDYVAMRRHEDAERYLESFSKLREKLADVELVEVKEIIFGEQLSLFKGA